MFPKKHQTSGLDSQSLSTVYDVKIVKNHKRKKQNVPGIWSGCDERERERESGKECELLCDSLVRAKCGLEDQTGKGRVKGECPLNGVRLVTFEEKGKCFELG
jgi:hypothetical protein